MRHQVGITLVELMISLALGLFVILVASALFLSTKAGYTVQEDDLQIQENGRYAIENISRAVRQAAFENWDSAEAPVVARSAVSANINGLDAVSLGRNTDNIQSPVTPAVNGSDVLAVRFFGAGAPPRGDNTITNCAGYGVPAPTDQRNAENERGWSIFYVAKDSSGEPELRCKYLGMSEDGSETNWTSEAIVRGVESFQVLYGLDTDADGLPNRYVNATAISALDGSLAVEGDTEEEQNTNRNKRTHWKKVVVVKIALLVRGEEAARSDALNAQYDLFGKDYADANNATDAGTRIRESALNKASRNRTRKIFTSTIQLRNQAAGSAT